MKLKALVLGLLIAGATAVTYTAIDDVNAEIAVDKRKIKIPGGQVTN